jgi:hypothetical protein
MKIAVTNDKKEAVGGVVYLSRVPFAFIDGLVSVFRDAQSDAITMDEEKAKKAILEIAEWLRTNEMKSSDADAFARELAHLLLEEAAVDDWGGCRLCGG